MSKFTDWMDRSFYPGSKQRWDDLLFREEIVARLGKDVVLLDLGAGAGIVPEMNFRELTGKACGVDPDSRVLQNPNLDEGKIGTGEAIPYDNDTFDVVLADNVLEHLSDPVSVFSEVSRVLRSGGVFLFKTPNRYHYMPVIARITPHRFHQWINKKRGRAYQDTFPTLYLANTEADIRKAIDLAGLRIDKITFVEGRPEYLRFSALTYVLGWFYERLVNASQWFRRFRVVIIGSAVKP